MAKLKPLHRRTIRAVLRKERDWPIDTHTDGTVDFPVPATAASIGSFVDDVYDALKALGYDPTITVLPATAGKRISRVTTKETLADAPRGAHL